MKAAAIAGLALASMAPALAAAPADVVYTEGRASIRYYDGPEQEAFIGDVVNRGDTVITGWDGLVELDRQGVSVRISPDTVFTIQERGSGQEKQDVFSLALGSVKYRYDRLTGREPPVQTAACVMGVRGTEFTVFAGADGTSLVVVDQGQVEVQSAGESVQLVSEEGVEVRPGAPPGQKFKVQRDQMDYSTWNQGRITALLADPAEAMRQLGERLSYYSKNAAQYESLYQEYNQRLGEERRKVVDIQEKEGKEAADKYRTEVVNPLAVDTANLVLNRRYFALAALSLRRFVTGRIYLLLKSQYIVHPQDTVYTAFLSQYRRFLAAFESDIVPHLVEADI